jgi:hypothetical protein
MTGGRVRRWLDESVPAHPDVNPEHPFVIFGDHRFCAGKCLTAMPMPASHMHSQIELNICARRLDDLLV